MTNLEAFALRLRAVTAALAPTVGQACAEEAARSIAGILRDGAVPVEHGVWATLSHRSNHPETYGAEWGEIATGDEYRALWTAAVAAWTSVRESAEEA